MDAIKGCALPTSRDSSGTENTESCPPGIGSHISTSASGCSFRTAVSSGRSGSGAGLSSRHVSSTGGPSEPESLTSELNDPLRTNLNAYHGMAIFDALILAGHFAKVRTLSDCCRSDGKVELHRWESSRPEGEDAVVVVKRVKASRVNENRGKEPCEHTVHRSRVGRDAEDTLTEIGIYCYLARQEDMPQYLLRMHTVFESGSDVWLVLEHADGGDLFGTVQQNGGVEARQLLRWMWELLQAVNYLHKHRIGHRDISIENVLLRQGAVRLMDFGQAVATHSVDGVALRYTRPIGKPYYRPAECYVPSDPLVKVAMPAAAAEGDVVFARTDNNFLCEVRLASSAPAGQPTLAVPWGYAVAPVDVYACGICLFIMATGMPPYRQARLDDPHFVWLQSNAIAALLGAWRKPMPAETLALLEAALRPDPAARPSAETCLQEPCFASFRGESIPTHRASVHRPSLLAAGVPEAAAAHLAAAPRAAEQQMGAHLGSEWSEAVRSTGLAGDFYSPEEAHRSACASEPCPQAFAGARLSSFASCTGDFYCSPSDAHRSACGDAYAPGLFNDYVSDNFLGYSAVAASKAPPVPTSLPLERFSASSGAGQQPPEVSDGFALEKTTIKLPEGAVATEIGNHLLDFLTMVVGASVTKVNHKKFAIKADIDAEVGTCSLKVRLYSLPGSGAGDSASAVPPQLAVEFQRRAGDSPVLHWAFKKASDYLAGLDRKQRAPAADSADSAAPPPVGAASDAGKLSRSVPGGDVVQTSPARSGATATSAVPVPPPSRSKPAVGGRPSSGKAAASAAAALVLSPASPPRV